MDLNIRTSDLDPRLRRKHPRREFARRIGILSEGRYWMGQAVEISEGGMSFDFGQKLPIGKLLVLNFQLPGGHFVSVQGEVRSCDSRPKTGFVHGVQFKTLKIESRRFVRQFVSAQF